MMVDSYPVWRQACSAYFTASFPSRLLASGLVASSQARLLLSSGDLGENLALAINVPARKTMRAQAAKTWIGRSLRPVFGCIWKRVAAHLPSWIPGSSKQLNQKIEKGMMTAH